MPLLIAVLGALVAAVAVLAWHLVRRERTTRRRLDARLDEFTRDRDTQQRRRSIERDLEHGLEHAESEDEVLDLVHAALVALDPVRPVELHVVGAHDPMLHLAFATGETPEDASDTSSPWDSVAAREGRTLVYATTAVDDLCPHLEARLVEDCSAICVPLLATGRIVGVLYAMGPAGAAPSERLVDTYEAIARAAAGGIATTRAYGHPAASRSTPAPTHDLYASAHDDAVYDLRTEPERPPVEAFGTTGSHADALHAIDELLASGKPFSVALFAVDELGLYQARHGAAEAVDALQLVANVVAHVLGRDAAAFTIDNDRFAVALAEAPARDAVDAAEEIRDVLADEVEHHALAPFTLSFGVVEAGVGTTAERVLLAATDALYNARARGQGHTVVGIDVGATPA